MSSARRRHNHRLILERAYLTGRGNQGLQPQVFHHRNRREVQLLGASSLVNSAPTTSSVVSPPAVLDQSEPVTSSCTASLASTVSLSYQRTLPVVSSSADHLPISTASSPVSRTPSTSTNSTLSLSTISNYNASCGRQSTASLPRTVETEAEYRRPSGRHHWGTMTSQDSPEDGDGGPLFLGYPTSSIMASSLGLPDGHFDSTMPVKGEPFCLCYESGGDSENCTCGEEDTGENNIPYKVLLNCRFIASSMLMIIHSGQIRYGGIRRNSSAPCPTCEDTPSASI